MKKILLLVTLLFSIAFICFVSLAYFSDYNTISMTVYSVIALSGFALSFSNYSLAKIGKKNVLILLVSLLTLTSTFISFYSRNWFEVSWNFNLVGHVLVVCFALFKSLPNVHNWFNQLMKLTILFSAFSLIALLIVKWNNPLFYEVLSFFILFTFLGSVLTHFSRKKV